MTYSVKNAHWTPLYDARLDTGAKDRKPALELIRRAEITQSDRRGLVERDARRLHRPCRARRQCAGLGSLMVRYPEPPRQEVRRSVSEEQDSAKVQRLLPAPASPLGSVLGGFAEPSAKPAAEQQATAEIGAFQAAFKIPGRVSVSARRGAKRLAHLDRMTIAPDLVIRSAPVLDPTAFLEASFVQSEDAPLLPGRVSIYRDGMFVGRARWLLLARTRKFGSASAPTTRSRSSARCSSAMRAPAA